MAGAAVGVGFVVEPGVRRGAADAQVEEVAVVELVLSPGADVDGAFAEEADQFQIGEPRLLLGFAQGGVGRGFSGLDRAGRDLDASVRGEGMGEDEQADGARGSDRCG